MNTTLQTPLSRRGVGPGLLVVVPKEYKDRTQAEVNKTLDPEPLQKWAEEGFAVVEVKVDAESKGDEILHIQSAIRALVDLPQCTPSDTIGVIGM